MRYERVKPSAVLMVNVWLLPPAVRPDGRGTPHPEVAVGTAEVLIVVVETEELLTVDNEEAGLTGVNKKEELITVDENAVTIADEDGVTTADEVALTTVDGDSGVVELELELELD